MNAPVINFAEPTFGNIPLSCVIPSTTNPRKRFDDADLADLAASIKQHGVAQPILVRPLPTTAEHIDCVEIVAGERRYRASKLAGLTVIPAICRQMTDAEALEVQVVENLQRKDVHPIEEAEGYDQLMKLHGYTADQLAEKVGKSRAYIYGRLKLCALAPAARQAFFNDKLSASTALLIARIPVEQLQEKATQEITAPSYGEPLSYRRAVDHVRNRYMLELDDAPFSLDDAKLVKAAGSCMACPKRTGSMPELFPDVDAADVCTDPDCFATKRVAHGEKVLAIAARKKIPIYESKDAGSIRSDRNLATAESQLYSFDRPDNVSTWRSIDDVLTPEQLPPAVGYIRHENGDAVPVFEKTAVQLALEKAGLCKTLEQHTAAMQEKAGSGGLAHDDDDDDQSAPALRTVTLSPEKAAKAAIAEQEVNVRIAAMKRIREASKAGMTAAALRILVLNLLDALSCPDELGPVFDADFSTFGAIKEFTDTADAGDLQLMLAGMAVGDGFVLSHYDIDVDNTFDRDDSQYALLVELASASGVDLDQVRIELAPQPEQGEQTDQVTCDNVELLPVSIEGQVKIGDRVRMNDDAKGPGGKKRKCCGKEGAIAEILDGASYVIQFGDLPKDRVAGIGADEFKRILPVEAAAWPFPTGARP